MTKKTEATTPPDIVNRLLRAAGDEVVLVGGQALGFWVLRYDLVLPPDVPAISNDTDFLAQSAAARGPVEAFAKAIQGRAFYPSRLARTSIVGQAELDISADEFINVDVIFKVTGLTAESVRARAVRVKLDDHSFLVMHPLHVLHSRLANLYTLKDKQNEKGAMQLAMAINVAREFLRAVASEATPAANARGRSPIQRYVTEIERLAVEDAGKKVAARWRLHVADAIDPSLIPAGPFWNKKWPDLQTLMSPDYTKQFAAPPSAANVGKAAAKRSRRRDTSK